MQNSEFGVYEHAILGDSLEVIGRCHDGIVRIGDRFRFGYVNIIERKDRIVYVTGVKDTCKLDVEVVEISTYKIKVDELYAGGTAKLVLKGEGIDLINDEMILSTLPATSKVIPRIIAIY